MELVEDDECHPFESGISLEAPGENAVGDDLDPGDGGDPAFVTCGEADGLSDAFAEECRHSCGGGAGCHPTGLEQEHASVHPRLVQKAKGNDRCLARARLSLKDRSTDPGEGCAELFDDLFDRKPGRRRLGDSVHGPEYGIDVLRKARPPPSQSSRSLSRHPATVAISGFVSHSTHGRCLHSKQSNGGDIMSSSPRIPEAELTGLYGAVVKRVSRKMFGEVPEPVGVEWHNRKV